MAKQNTPAFFAIHHGKKTANLRDASPRGN